MAKSSSSQELGNIPMLNIGGKDTLKYYINGDDSSDEELEDEYCRQPLRAENYNSVNTTLDIAYDAHHITQLTTEQQDKLNSVMDQLQKYKNFITDKNKISHTSRVKTKVLKYLEDNQDIYSKAVINAYENSKSQSIPIFKNLAETELKKLCSNSTSEKVHIDLKWSLICQDLGIRLLTSAPVRKLYFSQKEKILGKFEHLPNDAQIHQLLQKGLEDVLSESEYKGDISCILKGDTYTKVLNIILHDKRKIFSFTKKKFFTDSLFHLLEDLVGTMNALLKENSLVDVEDLTDAFSKNINLLNTGSWRPVLPDATIFSSQNISNTDSYLGAEALFCYVRMIHCSVKRFIKNAKQDSTFDGAVFSRGWAFDMNKKLYAIEKQTISNKFSLTSEVLYPYSSSYQALLGKLQDFCEDLNMQDTDIIEHIKSILKTGHLSTAVQQNDAFEQFIMVFTYHLFGTEVERHPAAAIHNIMVLDLVKTIGIEQAFQHLPMALASVVPVIRGIQTILTKRLELPYYYDGHIGKTAEPSDEPFKNFILKEQKLVSAWLAVKELSTDALDEVLAKIDVLCQEYYGIRLVISEDKTTGPLIKTEVDPPTSEDDSAEQQKFVADFSTVAISTPSAQASGPSAEGADNKTNKQFGINAIEEDLIKFKEVKDNPEKLEEFLDGYQKTYAKEGVSSHDDVYSLLLNAAIGLKDEETVKFILKDDHGDILTPLDESFYSPIAYTLYSGNQVILDTVKSYIEQYLSGETHQKVKPCRQGNVKILNSMMYPEFLDMTKPKYMEILEPLYCETTVFTTLLGTFDGYNEIE